MLDQALHGEETANFEFPLMTKAGVRLEVLLNATTRRDEQGNIIGVVGIGQDITGRLAQEREYTRLIDTANAPIFGVNTLGVRLFFVDLIFLAYSVILTPIIRCFFQKYFSARRTQRVNVWNKVRAMMESRCVLYSTAPPFYHVAHNPPCPS